MKKKIVFFIGVGGLIALGVVLFILFVIYRDARKTNLFSQDTTSMPTVGRSQQTSTPPIVYGYLPYWTKNKAFYSSALTHISFFSLGIQADGKVVDIPRESQETGYRAVQNGVLSEIKDQINSNQKIELTLTMMDQEAIPIFLRDTTAQERFLEDIKKIIVTQPISGINIDIEYNGIVDDTLQHNLANLLHQTNTILKQHTPPLHLSVATYSDAGDLQRLTHLKLIEPEVDHIIMMAYDFHRSKSPNAGPNAPLYGKSQGKWAEDIMSDLQKYTQVVPSEKIILGIPFYGYAWSVEDAKNPNSFTLPKSGESVPYANIQNLLSRPDVVRYWDTQALSPYLMYSAGGKAKILYYDDPESLSYKMTLVRQANLGGIAIWALGYDEGDKKLWDSIR